LAYCMRDTAARVIGDIEVGVQGRTLAQMLDLYEARFLPSSASTLAQAKFENSRQETKESIQAYHGRLRDLWHRAYPTAAARQETQGILVARFVKGLRRIAVRNHVLRSAPTTYLAALEAAQREQSVVYTTEAMTGAAGDTREEPMDITAMDRGETCHGCGSTYHFVRDCPINPRRGRGRGNPGFGRGAMAIGRGTAGRGRGGNSFRGQVRQLQQQARGRGVRPAWRKVLAAMEAILDEEDPADGEDDYEDDYEDAEEQEDNGQEDPNPDF
jgi:hypothetical protein